MTKLRPDVGWQPAWPAPVHRSRLCLAVVAVIAICAVGCERVALGAHVEWSTHANQEGTSVQPMDAALVIQGGDSNVSSRTAAFTWPTWARTARIAGAYFSPDDDDAAIDARLDRLVEQNVSVVLADSPWGEQYAAWVDDARFNAVRDVVAKVVKKAHQRGLKVVMYQVGLELISEAGRNPGLEHPEWAQLALDGTPVLFDDVSNEQEHWLQEGVWDFWLSPCGGADSAAGSFRELAFERVRAIVATGIDGLWVDQVYLQSSVGDHHDLWPSSDPCSAAAFQAEVGMPMPAGEDWDSPAFQRWLVWRHAQVVDFLQAEKEVARAVNPDIVFFNENSSVDSGRSTYVAADPAALLDHADMSTGHEIETIADRMDEGETGMKAATLDQWLAFRTMVAFARGVDRGKPSWVLTYGYRPRDSAQLAGLVLAEGANFYETKGPQMADTVGAEFRRQLFGWVATHQAHFYDTEAAAEVALLYSPRNRDLIDTVSGEPYDVADSTHFAAYRAAANRLFRAHIPFDVVIDVDHRSFAGYRVLVAPQVQAMSDATIAALQQYTGTVITVGAAGTVDEWLVPRPRQAWPDLGPARFAAPSRQMAAAADTGLLTTDAPPSVQIGLRRGAHGYSLVLVNLDRQPTPALTIVLRAELPATAVSASLWALDGTGQDVPVTRLADGRIQLAVPAGIDSVALLAVPNEQVANLWLPVVRR